MDTTDLHKGEQMSFHLTVNYPCKLNPERTEDMSTKIKDVACLRQISVKVKYVSINVIEDKMMLFDIFGFKSSCLI